MGADIGLHHPSHTGEGATLSFTGMVSAAKPQRLRASLPLRQILPLPRGRTSASFGTCTRDGSGLRKAQGRGGGAWVLCCGVFRPLAGRAHTLGDVHPCGAGRGVSA